MVVRYMEINQGSGQVSRLLSWTTKQAKTALLLHKVLAFQEHCSSPSIAVPDCPSLEATQKSWHRVYIDPCVNKAC
jgi:hypothetical protein